LCGLLYAQICSFGCITNFWKDPEDSRKEDAKLQVIKRSRIFWRVPCMLVGANVHLERSRIFWTIPCMLVNTKR